jgi:hypothetical protein
MAEDRSLSGFIRSQNKTKLTIELEMIKELDELIGTKTSDYGPVCEVIDLVFDVTGYAKAHIPGGEAQVAGRCLSKLVRYLNLRAKEVSTGSLPNTESLEDSLRDFLGETVRLFGECQANRGTKILHVSPSEKKVG